MTFLAAVGSFASPTSSSYVITLPAAWASVTPVAVIFWTGGASGGWTANTAESVGFAAYNSAKSAYQYGCVGDACANARTSSTKTAEKNRLEPYPLSVLLYDGTIKSQMTSVSFSNQTITCTFGTYATSYTIHYLAIGGSDVTNAGVVSWTSPTSATSKGVTGLGFKPDMVLHIANEYPSAGTGNGAQMGPLGAMDSAGNQWAFVSMASLNAATNQYGERFQRTDNCIINNTWNSTTVTELAHYTSMDTDGFTVTWGTNTSGGYLFYSLALKGGNYQVGNFAKSTAVAPTSNQVTTTGMNPAAILTLTDDHIAATAVQNTGMRWMMGASDGTNNHAAGANIKNVGALGNPTPTSVDYGYDDTSHSLAVAENDTQSTEAVGTITTASGSFTANWSTNTAVATQICYIAMGGSAQVNKTVAMTYPDTTYDDAAATPSIKQDRSVTMTYPDSTLDDSPVSILIEQDRSVAMTHPDTAFDDYPVGVSIEQDRTVAMPYSDTTYDDYAITATVEQDRAVSMPYPNTTYDDAVLSVGIEQDRSVAMTYPDATFDDYAVGVSIQQDRTVLMPYPDTTFDDYPIGVLIEQDRTAVMTCPDTTFDDAPVVASVGQDRTVAMSYPDTTYDDYAVGVSLISNPTVLMTCPDTTFDDAPPGVSIQQDRSVTMPYPTAVYDDYAVVVTVGQDRTVSMTHPDTTYDDQPVVVTIGEDRTVAMTCPDTTYDDYALSAHVTQDRSVAMPYPDSVLDDYAVVVSRTSNPTVLMSCPGTTFDDAPMAASIAQSRTVMMPYPDTLFEPQAVGVIASISVTVAMTCPTAEWGASAVAVTIRQDRTVLMPFPTAELDGEDVAVSRISNPTVAMPCPDTLFSVEPVEVWILDKAHIINVEGCIETLIRLEGSRSPVVISGSRTNSVGLLGSSENIAHLEGSEVDMLEEQWIKDPPIRRGISMAIEAPIYTDSAKTSLASNLSSGTVIWRLLGEFESEMLVKTSDDPTEIAVDTPLNGYVTIYLRGDDSLDWSPGIYDHEAVIIVTEEPEGLFEGKAVVI